MWTKNPDGYPYCWVHPSHKPAIRDDMSKSGRLMIATAVLEWWESAAAPFLAWDEWTFAVDKEGNYLPGKHNLPAPEDFAHELGTWSLKLWTLPKRERIPHLRSELTSRREELHKVVTIVLMNLIGSAMAGKWLAETRKAHGLPKLRKSDIIGVQGLLF